MNDEAVYRTAPATPGLLNIKYEIEKCGGKIFSAVVYTVHTFRIHSNVAINWEAQLLPGGQRQNIIHICKLIEHFLDVLHKINKYFIYSVFCKHSS